MHGGEYGSFGICCARPVHGLVPAGRVGVPGVVTPVWPGTVEPVELDAAGLQRVAPAGGGRFARLAPDDRDITSLFPSASLPPSAALEESGEEYEADVWRDRGLYLALALLPLLLLSFRRGWICGVVLLVAALPTPRADAFEGMIRKAGFRRTGYERLTGGVVAIHSGWKP